jgi:hypothetical protein
MKCKMEQHDYFELIGTVREEMNWAFIVEAYTRGLPAGMFTKEHIKSIEALRAAEILDRQSKLDPKWRKAIDDVSAGRPVHELSEYDKKCVVDVWYRSEFK